jgi:hypothetical protein
MSQDAQRHTVTDKPQTLKSVGCQPEDGDATHRHGPAGQCQQPPIAQYYEKQVFVQEAKAFLNMLSAMALSAESQCGNHHFSEIHVTGPGVFSDLLVHSRRTDGLHLMAALTDPLEFKQPNAAEVSNSPRNEPIPIRLFLSGGIHLRTCLMMGTFHVNCNSE